MDFLNKILASVDPSIWREILEGVVASLKSMFTGRSHFGIYEILEYDGVLEILDVQGRKAVYKKRQRVRFLQEGVIAFQDHAWGDGDPVSQYSCSPGAAVDRYRDGDRWNVLISLRETKAINDIQDFYTERTIRHGFLKSEEWWQLEMYHEIRYLKCSIIFPKERHCRKAALVFGKSDRPVPLGSDNFVILPDGRQMLTWENISPERFQVYTLKWEW